MMNRFDRSARYGVITLAAFGLGACSLSLTPEAPSSLLTLSPLSTTVPTGSTTRISDGPIEVRIPEVPAKLDVARIPVQVTDTEIAYLQETYWVERPARLFRRLLGESLRARGPMLVLDSDDTPALAQQTLRGTLLEMGFDAQTSSVVVRYDAVRTDSDGAEVMTKRFQAREDVTLTEEDAIGPGVVGPALNRAANRVAAEVAQWVIDNPPTQAENEASPEPAG